VRFDDNPEPGTNPFLDGVHAALAKRAAEEKKKEEEEAAVEAER